MKWQRWHAALLGAAGAALILVFVFKRESGPSGSLVDAGAAEPPARPVDAHLCDLFVTSPNGSWSKLQRGIGGAMGILPATLPGVVVALADLDSLLANELDGAAPMYGVAAGDPSNPSFAFAMKLVDPRRARGLLVDGDTARYTAKSLGTMTLLVPTRSAERGLELALTQNGYVVLARSAADVERLGPYVTRTLPARPLPAEPVVIDMPRGALETALRPKLDALWKSTKSFLLAQDERMRAERGRAPDFGDPVAIVGALDAFVSRRIAIVGDLDRLRVALDVTDDAAVLVATLVPLPARGPARQWVDGMRLGDAAAVLEMPAAVAVALSTRDGEAERAEQSKELEAAIRASLGPRLKDPERLHDVIEGVAKARDESFVATVSADEPFGFVLRARVRDPAIAERSLRGALDLARLDPFKEFLHVRDVTSSSEDVPGLGKVSVAKIAREPKRAGSVHDAGAARPRAAPSDLGVAWIAEGEADRIERGAPRLRGDETAAVLTLAAGPEPLVTLKVGAKPDCKLADEPSLARFTTAVAKDATTVVVAQPLRLDPRRANLPVAPLAIAVGRKGSDAFVRIEIADGLLREAARWQMGF